MGFDPSVPSVCLHREPVFIDPDDPDGWRPSDFRVHFGIIPIEKPARPGVMSWGTAAAEVFNHAHPTIEKTVPLADRSTLTVTGSWEEWGADGHEANDNSLHVVLEPQDDVFPGEPISLAIQVEHAYELLRGRVAASSRVLDCAIVTTAEWHEKVGVYHLVGDEARSYPAIESL